jgi:threonine aldolase
MIAPELISRYQTVRAACEHRITGQPPMSMADQLAAMAEQASRFDSPDVYGSGELIGSFESDIARMLGKPAAVFLPSGTMAQCIALRIWADRVGSRQVAFHSTSHLQIHEQGAYSELYGLQAETLGEPDRVPGLADLIALQHKPSAVLLELPMREIGGQLPSWDDLTAQSEWARQQGVALHLDGARLWQCAVAYDRTLAEIAALFDSVYVSFYKDIGGIAGSVLTGPSEFINESRIWIRRAGGNLYSMFPYILAAKAGMERNLAKLPDAVDDARWLAERLNAFDALQTQPLEPPTNLFHLRVESAPESLIERACAWSERNRVFLVPVPRAVVDGYSIMEFGIGQAIRSATRAQWQHWLDDFWH